MFIMINLDGLRTIAFENKQMFIASPNISCVPHAPQKKGVADIWANFKIFLKTYTKSCR